jgi:hypothetical protein
MSITRPKGKNADHIKRSKTRKVEKNMPIGRMLKILVTVY